jgi:hypothetical protein
MWLQDYKTENENQSQISRVWLAEMATGSHFSQSDAWDLRLVSNLSFIIVSSDSDAACQSQIVHKRLQAKCLTESRLKNTLDGKLV